MNRPVLQMARLGEMCGSSCVRGVLRADSVGNARMWRRGQGFLGNGRPQRRTVAWAVRAAGLSASGIAASLFGGLIPTVAWGQSTGGTGAPAAPVAVTISDTSAPNYDIERDDTVLSVAVTFAAAVPPSGAMITNAGTIAPRRDGAGLRISDAAVIYQSNGGKLFGGIQFNDAISTVRLAGAGLIEGPIAGNSISTGGMVRLGSDVGELVLRSGAPNSLDGEENFLIRTSISKDIVVNGAGMVVFDGSLRSSVPASVGPEAVQLEAGGLEIRNHVAFSGGLNIKLGAIPSAAGSPAVPAMMGMPAIPAVPGTPASLAPEYAGSTGPTFRISGTAVIPDGETFGYSNAAAVTVPGLVYGRLEFVVNGRGRQDHGQIVFRSKSGDPFPIHDKLQHAVRLTDMVGDRLSIVVVDGHNDNRGTVSRLTSAGAAQIAVNSNLYRAEILSPTPLTLEGMDLSSGSDLAIQISRISDEELGLSSEYAGLMGLVFAGLSGDSAALIFHEIGAQKEELRLALDDLRPDQSGASTQPMQHAVGMLQSAVLRQANEARFREGVVADQDQAAGRQGISEPDGSGISAAGENPDAGLTSVWASGLYGAVGQDGTVQDPGFSDRAIGVTVGVDRRIHDGGASIGISYGFLSSSTKPKNGAKVSYDTDTHGIQVYGSASTFDGQGYFSFAAGVAQHDVVSRHTQSYFNRVAIGDRFTYSLAGQFESGARMRFHNAFGWQEVIDVTPHIGFRLQRTLRDSYQETGAGGLGMRVTRSTYQRPQLLGGASARTNILVGGVGQLETLLMVRAAYDVEGDQATILATNPNNPARGVRFGVPSPPRLQFDLEVKIGYRLADSFSVEVGYQASVASRWLGHGGNVALAYAF